MFDIIELMNWSPQTRLRRWVRAIYSFAIIAYDPLKIDRENWFGFGLFVSLYISTYQKHELLFAKRIDL